MSLHLHRGLWLLAGVIVFGLAIYLIPIAAANDPAPQSPTTTPVSDELGAVCVQIQAQDSSTSASPPIVGGSTGVKLLIFDTSGSMDDIVVGTSESRLAIAKRSVAGYIDSLPTNTQIGLRQFDGGCGSSLTIPIATLNHASFKATVESLFAFGSTPLADSILAAGTDIQGITGRKEIILITDGEESCGGNPIQVAQALVRQNPSMSIHVIGFAINPSFEDNLRNIATAGNGTYISANTGQELQTALGIAGNEPFQVYTTDGGLVKIGVANYQPIFLNPGTYNLNIPTLNIIRQPFQIRANQGTTLLISGTAIRVIENDKLCYDSGVSALFEFITLALSATLTSALVTGVVLGARQIARISRPRYKWQKQATPDSPPYLVNTVPIALVNGKPSRNCHVTKYNI